MGKASRERKQRIMDGDPLGERLGMTEEAKAGMKALTKEFGKALVLVGRNPLLGIALLAGMKKQREHEKELEGGTHGDQKESRKLEDKS